MIIDITIHDIIIDYKGVQFVTNNGESVLIRMNQQEMEREG